MALDPTRKSAIRERLSFYRELGIGPLYRREVRDDASVHMILAKRWSNWQLDSGDEIAADRNKLHRRRICRQATTAKPNC